MSLPFLVKKDSVTLLEYAYLADDVYKSAKSLKRKELAAWTRISEKPFKFTYGFKARLYIKNTGEAIVAYRGTVIYSSGNLVADLAILLKIYSHYDTLAKEFYKWSVNYLYFHQKKKGGSIFPNVTGHSLGGYLAQLVAAENPGIIAVTFNAPGVSEIYDPTFGYINSNKEYPDIYNFFIDYDFIHQINNLLGSSYELHGDRACSPEFMQIYRGSILIFWHYLICIRTQHSTNKIINILTEDSKLGNLKF